LQLLFPSLVGTFGGVAWPFFGRLEMLIAIAGEFQMCELLAQHQLLFVVT
jgi:hypothetical protein